MVETSWISWRISWLLKKRSTVCTAKLLPPREQVGLPLADIHYFLLRTITMMQHPKGCCFSFPKNLTSSFFIRSSSCCSCGSWRRDGGAAAEQQRRSPELSAHCQLQRLHGPADPGEQISTCHPHSCYYKLRFFNNLSYFGAGIIYFRLRRCPYFGSSSSYILPLKTSITVPYLWR